MPWHGTAEVAWEGGPLWLYARGPNPFSQKCFHVNWILLLGKTGVILGGKMIGTIPPKWTLW